MELSDYILGLWRINQWGNTPQQNLTLIKQCLELGINTFDQANIYGWEPSCEELFGEALKLAPTIREQTKIISKFNICAHDLPQGHVPHYDSSYKHVIRSVDLSLKRMGIEHLDALLIHRLDYLLNVDEVAQAFQKLKQQGKVLEFGVSNFSASHFSMLQSRLDFHLITNQLEINPLRFTCLEDGTLDQCQEKKIRPMAWSPLAGGELFSEPPNKQCQRVISTLNDLGNELKTSIDQVAIAWIKKHPSNPHIILGTKNIERIKSALNTDNFTLTNEQWYRIWSASKGHNVP